MVACDINVQGCRSLHGHVFLINNFGLGSSINFLLHTSWKDIYVKSTDLLISCVHDQQDPEPAQLRLIVLLCFHCVSTVFPLCIHCVSTVIQRFSEFLLFSL